MESLFKLPDELTLAPLLQQFPGREHQIRSLASLVSVRTSSNAHSDASSRR